MYAKQDKPQNGAEVLKFFDWAIKNGQKMAEELDYVPLPPPVVAQIEDGLEGARSRTRPARRSGKHPARGTRDRRSVRVSLSSERAVATHTGM